MVREQRNKKRKKKALHKDFWMEIRKTRARFISIFFIVALGVAFFSGIQSASPDMRYSGDAYYDANRLMDLKVMGTLGMTEKDLEALRGVKGVEAVEGSYGTDVAFGSGAGQRVLHVEAVTERMNDLTPDQGELPTERGQCFLDSMFAANNGYQVGDTIELEEDEESLLKVRTYQIVGIGTSPMYISFNRGNTTLGSGEINGFLYVTPDCFDSEVYTQAYLLVKGADILTSYTDEYTELVEQVESRIKGIQDIQCQARYEEVLAQAEEELSDARKELADGKKEAQEKLEKAEKELADARKKLDDGQKEYEDGKNQLSDARTELADGRKQLEDARKELTDGRQQLASAKEELVSGQSQIDSAKNQLSGGWAQLGSAKQELAAGWSQYYASGAQLESGKTQWNQAKEELASGREQLEAGKAQLAAGWEAYQSQYALWQQKQEELTQAEEQLARGESALAEGQQKLQEQRAAYETGMAAVEEGEAGLQAGRAGLAELQAQYQAGEAALAVQQTQYEQGMAAGIFSEEELAAMAGAIEAAQGQLAAMQSQITAVQAELSAKESMLAQSKAELAAAETQLTAGEAELAARSQELAQSRAQVEAGKAQMEEGGRQLQAAQAELQASQAEIDEKEQELTEGEQLLAAKEAELTQGEQALAAAEAKLVSGQAELAANEQALAAGQAELTANEQKMASGRQTVTESEKKLADGEKELQKNEKKLADGEKELQDNEKKLKDAGKELDAGEKEYQEGYEEYLKGKKDAEEEIADGEQKIRDAEQELKKLSVPEWYVTDRNDLPEYSDYGDNADRIRNIGKVFPVMFFLVAALISLTTMTRMVEEHRTQIGTMKALGYGKLDIASKYLNYAFLATVGGSILGILVGEKILPYIIIKAYGIMYVNMATHLRIDYEFRFALIASIASVVCTMGATLSACYRALVETPASLMRPPAPKEGKRVFLERIPFLWKRLSFTWKSTVRNLFRYKKRFLMTVFGISGSMALMLVGFGIRDSVMDVAVRQYEQIQHYDGMVIKDEDASAEEMQELLTYMDGQEELDHYNHVLLNKLTTPRGRSKLSIYLYVPENPEIFKQDVTLRDRVTRTPYELTDEGVVICEKTARLLDLEVGDSFILEEDNKQYSAKITAITENYMSHFVYMTPALYREVFGQEPEYNEAVFTLKPESLEKLDSVGQEIMKQPAALSISYTSSLKSQLDRMLSTLGTVIVVLIVSAGMLAFVVLYNLNNINITERQRELATLKVLGFFDGEVSQYVFRENILLTILGIVGGVFLGILLHRFVIVTVEVDAVMFGRDIAPVSFLYCALITCGFSAFVNLVMHYKLKKIDMVESLKSVE